MVGGHHRKTWVTLSVLYVAEVVKEGEGSVAGAAWTVGREVERCDLRVKDIDGWVELVSEVARDSWESPSPTTHVMVEKNRGVHLGYPETTASPHPLKPGWHAWGTRPNTNITAQVNAFVDIS